MKKLSLLLVLFIFGCQSLNQQPVRENRSNQQSENPNTTIEQPRSNFFDQELVTPKSDKKKIPVALFLPISGKNQELGQSLVNAATISLFDNDLNHNIELVLIDSKESPEDAKKGFAEIINRKIKIVIGPIFSSSAEAIAKDAMQNKITVISLSNNRELSHKINNDGGVFLAGMMPEAQIDKIVNYSMDQGKYNFAVISPNNQYGNTITTLFKKVVKDRDGNYITSEFYKNSSDIDRVVDRVINSFTISHRLKAKVKKGATVSESDRTYPQVILVPESGNILSKIVASIQRQNVDEREFQIVGTSQWDDISTLNDRNLVGSWFAAPENEKFRNFEKIYYQTYQKFPPRISTIAYDMVGAIANLSIMNGEKTPTLLDFINYQPSPKNGFEGIDGLFRFLPNGLIQRNLAVLKVESGRFEVIDKPAEQFLRY
jgi:branched-chain amino acid transport system substrate-binding protein